MGTKAVVRTVDDHGIIYSMLVFACPGCAAGGPPSYDGIHALPIKVDGEDNGGKPSWTWNGDLEKPTLHPSILTRGDRVHARCHSYLRDGVFEFLNDCEHPLVDQLVPIPDLPLWAAK